MGKKYEVPPMDPALAQEFQSMREGAEANTQALATSMEGWFDAGSIEEMGTSSQDVATQIEQMFGSGQLPTLNNGTPWQGTSCQGTCAV